jgi:hypothetical protein
MAWTRTAVASDTPTVMTRARSATSRLPRAPRVEGCTHRTTGRTHPAAQPRSAAVDGDCQRMPRTTANHAHSHAHAAAGARRASWPCTQTRTKGSSLRNVFSPMPWISRSSRTWVKRPWVVRQVRIRWAMTGPIPGRASRSEADAVLRSTVDGDVQSRAGVVDGLCRTTEGTPVGGTCAVGARTTVPAATGTAGVITLGLFSRA